MTRHQKYAAAGITTGLVSVLFVYLIKTRELGGLVLAGLFISAWLLGLFSIAALLSAVTKNPGRTFEKLARIVDYFIIWP